MTEFSNKMFNAYFMNRDIKIIHTKLGHPKNKGIMERLHKEIKNTLYIK